MILASRLGLMLRLSLSHIQTPEAQFKQRYWLQWRWRSELPTISTLLLASAMSVTQAVEFSAQLGAQQQAWAWRHLSIWMLHRVWIYPRSPVHQMLLIHQSTTMICMLSHLIPIQPVIQPVWLANTRLMLVIPTSSLILTWIICQSGRLQIWR